MTVGSTNTVMMISMGFTTIPTKSDAAQLKDPFTHRAIGRSRQDKLQGPQGFQKFAVFAALGFVLSPLTPSLRDRGMSAAKMLQVNKHGKRL